MMIRQISVLIIALAACTTLQAQAIIQGRIVDEELKAVPGANVHLEGSYDGTSTDSLGVFSFTTTLNGSQLLIISFVGYIPQAIPLDVEDDQFIEIQLVEDLAQMDPLVITAGVFDAGVSGKGEILKPLDIVTTAGATADIAGALNTLPGTTTVGEEGRLFVRGGDGDETLTYIDGLGVLDSYSTSLPNVATRSRFSPMMFKGMSFSTGGYSAEYGQALSSALILNTKDVATTSRSDISLMTVGADIAHTETWKHSSFAGKIQYTNLAPYMALVKQRIDWSHAPESIEGNFAYRRAKGNSIFKSYAQVNSSTMKMNYIPIGDADSVIPTQLDNQYIYLNTSLNQQLSKKSSVRGGASYTYSNTRGIQPVGVLTDQLHGLHFKVATFYDPASFISINAGTEFFNYQNLRDRTGEQGTVSDQASYLMNGTFVEADWFISPRITLRSGARLEYLSNSSSFDINPRLSAAFKSGEKSQLGLSWGRFNQQPGFDHLVRNNALTPQQAEHLILSYQVRNEGRAFRAEVFNKSYTNLIKTEPTLTNNGAGYARGIDLFWRDNQTFNNVDYWISYSYLDTERDYLNYPIPATPAFASTHNLSIVYKQWFQALRSQLGLSYIYGSPRPYNDPNSTEFNGSRTPHYHNLSMNISYLMKQNVIMYFSISNISGRKNIFGYEYAPEPDPDGVYPSREVVAPADSFIFLGVFITLSKQKTLNQLPNL